MTDDKNGSGNGNPAVTKNWPGRPRKYQTSEEFDDAVDEYVEACRAAGTPLLWTGLALHMGFASRVAIDAYAKYDGFNYSVTRAKTIIESGYEERLHTNAPTGGMFALKNMGWSDNRGVDVTSGGKPAMLPILAVPDNGRGDMIEGELPDNEGGDA